MKQVLYVICAVLAITSAAYADSAAKTEKPSIEIILDINPEPNQEAERQRKMSSPYKIGKTDFSVDLEDVPFENGESVLALDANGVDIPPFKVTTAEVSVSRKPDEEDSESKRDVFNLTIPNATKPYDEILVGGAKVSKNPKSATGTLCNITSDQRLFAYEKPAVVGKAANSNAKLERKLPVNSCSLSLNGRTYLFQTRVWDVFRGEGATIQTELTISHGKSQRVIKSQYDYRVLWAGDLNDDGKLDLITYEEVTHVSGAGGRTLLHFSADSNSKEDELNFVEGPSIQRPGC